MQELKSFADAGTSFFSEWAASASCQGDQRGLEGQDADVWPGRNCSTGEWQSPGKIKVGLLIREAATECSLDRPPLLDLSLEESNLRILHPKASRQCASRRISCSPIWMLFERLMWRSTPEMKKIGTSMRRYPG